MMWRWSINAALALALLCLPVSVIAYEPDEVLKDARLEARARNLSGELRCLVCQNQSIDDSNAPLARDLRLLIRERLTKGDSDVQVIDFLVARYGEFVLLNPRFGTHTLVLWLTAPFLLILGMIGILINRRRAISAPPAPLTKAEKTALKKLID